jgi:DNA polymerase-3 subunit delta
MSVEVLKENIKNNAIGPIYVFYGEEGYLRIHYRNLLINNTVKDQFPEFNLHRFDGAFFSLPDFLGAVEGYPCLSERKMIIVKNLMPQKYGSILTQLRQGLLEMPETNTVIFEYDETVNPVKKCSELMDMLKKEKGVLCTFSTPKEGELATWVKRHIAAHKKAISNQDVTYLLSVCDHNMTHLYHEIEKICRFCSVDTVTRYHIDQMATRTLDAQVFELTGGLTSTDRAQALLVLNRLFQNKEEPIMILGAINAAFVRLLKVKAAYLANMGKAKIMELSGIKNDYALRRTQESAQRLSYEYIIFALRQCRICDDLLKGSRIDSRLALEILIGKLIDQKETGVKNA